MKPLSEGFDVQAAVLFLWLNLIALVQGPSKCIQLVLDVWNEVFVFQRRHFSLGRVDCWNSPGWMGVLHKAPPLHRRTGLLVPVVYYSGWYTPSQIHVVGRPMCCWCCTSFMVSARSFKVLWNFLVSARRFEPPWCQQGAFFNLLGVRLDTLKFAISASLYHRHPSLGFWRNMPPKKRRKRAAKFVRFSENQGDTEPAADDASQPLGWGER